ncbi:hypothetical protein LSTR_LSTR000051 [Laodelphax striatellus]|uniref:Uncharacterized protein n=1 Tax=Laodelphax striatellus TaxID=195883 RepID=A0A482X6E6_LAOST|nr:hypothetical protein LSTR_LSTR000051 [Laodelphax striatellus]
MSNQFCKDHTPIPHTEAMCHETGEKRQNLINKLKMFLDQVDDRPCLVKDGRQTSTRKPIIRYPGYVDYKHPAFNPQKLEDCLRPQPQPKTTENYCKHENHLEHIDEFQETCSTYENDCEDMNHECQNIDLHHENCKHDY